MVRWMQISLAALSVAGVSLEAVAQDDRWPAEKAQAWYDAQPWLVGCNFAPSTAINQLEMWQADSFDPEAIDRELGWAAGLGMNTARVFLHDIPWKEDPEAFAKRIDEFLTIADKHGIRPMFVLFDSVWDPHPQAGPQHAPKLHVHNSGWVQGPSLDVLKDPARVDELEPYVTGILQRYANDKRVLGWDLYNEPGNTNNNSYGKLEPPNKEELSFALLKKVFAWAREVNPSQPLTAGIWRDDWTRPEKISALGRYMLDHSDVISFHSYSPLPDVQKRVEALKKYGRPIVCTEYMSRGTGSTFQAILPYFKEQRVAAYNWGLVAGKTQTIYPWDSWDKTYTAEPELWFHDIFRADGTPYKAEEVEFIRQTTGRK